MPFLRRVHEEIEAAIAAGYDRAQTREAAVFARDRLPLVQGRIAGPVTQMIRASLKSNLYLPYVGQTRIESRYGPMSVLDYQAATITNTGTIDTLVEVLPWATSNDGQLRCGAP